MSDTFDLLGRRFEFAALGHGIDRADRLIAAFVPEGGTVRRGLDELQFSTAPGGVDLQLARSGRAPILTEHRAYVADMLGAIVDVAIDEDGLLQIVGRLASTTAANEVWHLLSDNFPMSVSLGSSILAAEPIGSNEHGGTTFQVTRWELAELSICLYGANREAYALRANDGHIASFVALRERDQEVARLRVRDSLQLDRWSRWSTTAALRLADRLGTDPALTHEVLAHEVRQEIVRLEHNLAA